MRKAIHTRGVNGFNMKRKMNGLTKTPGATPGN